MPDSILIHILSFVPTEDAVRTCVLSTRWKQIWASVPNLQFFFNSWQYFKFPHFIDRVLFFHELPRIQTFYLKCDEVDPDRLNTWVSVAIKRGVQELHIDVQNTEDFTLPPNLFTSNTLVRFKLRSCLQMDIPRLVRFPNLRVLHLSLHYPEEDVVQKLFCSCPVLEDFSLGGNIGNNQSMAFDISTLALKKLEIDFDGGEGFEYSENEFIINAPILEHLILRDDYFAQYWLKNLSSLVRADINVGLSCIEAHGFKERANEVYVLLKGISNVKYLTLGASTMGALDYADDNNLPLLFPNITHLELHVSDSYCWKRLPYLLSCMPNLENLALEVSTKKDVEHGNHGPTAEPNWIEPVPEWTPTCLLLHLKDIGLTGFTSKIYHLKLIEYLLENAEVLIKMTISTSNLAVEEEVAFLRHLVICRRAAKACTIELSGK